MRDISKFANFTLLTVIDAIDIDDFHLISVHNPSAYSIYEAGHAIVVNIKLKDARR